MSFSRLITKKLIIYIFFRYYYDKNIIQKTAGKRYVYRFVCDLERVFGCNQERYFQHLGLEPVKVEDSD